MSIKIDTKFLQTFLNLFGYSVKELKTVLAVDGNKGAYTIRVIKNYQTAKKIVVDGNPGSQTQGEVIKDIQDMFNDKGISKKCISGNLAADGKFESVSTKVTTCFQGIAGIAQDGVFYLQTLTKLAAYNSTSTNTPNTTTSNGWTRIYYTRDSQDTNYTCGPSSLKMALSVFGLYYSEDTLKTLVKAKSGVGTENANLVNAVNNLGKGLKAWNESFQSWERLQGYLAKGWPVILRIASYWTEGNEHFVLLAGINIKEGKVELGDPSSDQSTGFRATTTTDLLSRIKKVSAASVIVISK